MAVAGWCRQCGQHVWLNDQWGCANGHAWTEISGWYDTDTGAPVTPYWLQQQPSAEPSAPVQPPAPAATAPVQPPAPEVQPVVPPQADPAAPVRHTAAGTGTRDAVIGRIAEAFAQYPAYNVRPGTHSDLEIDNQVAEGAWGTGKKKVEYEAVLKAVEPEQTVYFWEILKEKGAGVSFGGFESESYSSFGGKRWGTKKEVVIGPGGKALDYTWDYAATRRIVEDVAAANGWRVKVVLRKKAAQW